MYNEKWGGGAVTSLELLHVLPVCPPLQLLEQIKTLEQALSQQSGEREELIGQLDKITEDHTSANHNTETMVGKIQVRACRLRVRKEVRACADSRNTVEDRAKPFWSVTSDISSETQQCPFHQTFCRRSAMFN